MSVASPQVRQTVNQSVRLSGKKGKAKESPFHRFIAWFMSKFNLPLSTGFSSSGGGDVLRLTPPYHHWTITSCASIFN